MSAREQVLLAAAVITLAAWAADRAVVSPLMTVWRGVHGGRAGLEKRLAEDRWLLAHRDRISAQKLSGKSASPRLLGDDAGELLDFTVSCARAHGVKIKNIQQGEATGSSGTRSVRVSVEGSWEEIATFIASLEDSSQRVIEKCSLTRSGETSLLQAQLLIGKVSST